MISILNVFFLFSCLFLLGLISVILHKNLFFILIGLEIMINSISLFLVCIGNYWNNHDGHMLYILIITISAIEASLSLSLLIQYFRNTNTLNINKLREIF
ncbi:NADH-quinone oxidoreductase subunit NuoK [Buchnera aphidicola]|uniref:NADH-quinone oxidoreductase subunit NuoK n=1 Tax=Buchnera aphidicola TaxID=9 RepID=UPI0034640CB2